MTQQTYFRACSVLNTAKVQQYLHTTETRDADDLAPRVLSTAREKKYKSSHYSKTKEFSFLNTTLKVYLCLQCICYADQTKHQKLTLQTLREVLDANCSLNLISLNQTQHYLLWCNCENYKKRQRRNDTSLPLNHSRESNLCPQKR